jgi:hypothetical protein
MSARPTISVDLAELECAIRRVLPKAIPREPQEIDSLARFIAEKAWIELSRGGFVSVSQTGDGHERLL